MVNAFRMIFGVLLVSVAACLGGSPSAAKSSIEISEICERAALTASARTGVPLDVLRSIALTETGTKVDDRLRPWPWTVNMEGDGRWFDDRQSAYNFAHRHYEDGARSFDIGCFQINYRWHSASFRSIEQMFDPEENAIYAAHFLNSLYAELGSWTKAAGAYHSRTPKFAAKYITRFERVRASLNAISAELMKPVERSQERATNHADNSFPLLRSGFSKGGAGSLVQLPAKTDSGRFIQLDRRQ